MTDDEEMGIRFNPWKLAYGIGADVIRSTLGEPQERVAAAVLLESIQQNPAMRELLDRDGGLDVDGVIAACHELVDAGMVTEDMGDAIWKPDMN